MASNIKVDIVKPTATNGSLSLKGDSGGSATANGITVNSSGNTSITGTTTISSADINGGTIDGTVIGGASAAAGTFTTITSTSTTTLGGNLVIPDSGTIGSASDTGAITIDSSGNVGVGVSTVSGKMHLSESGATDAAATIFSLDGLDSTFGANLAKSSGTYTTPATNISGGGWEYQPANSFNTHGTMIYLSAPDTNSSAATPVERLIIDSSGNVLVAKTSANYNTVGSTLYSSGTGEFVRSGGVVLNLNRRTNDGNLINFYQDGTGEGSISVSGTTVSFNGFTGTHWSRLLDGSTPDIPRGTILESLDEMMDWVKEDGTLEDDIKHVKCKISDTVESKNVYGLFFAWDNEDDYNDLLVAQEGSFVIRIHSSQNVQRGDLIQSNGDGTGKIQADDIIRSSTVAKVISTHRVETYEDGSYIVPCVIHC